MRMKHTRKNHKGFVLIGMLFTMVLMATTAISINQKASLETRMASNQTYATRVSLGQRAAIEHAAWKLTQTRTWRTDAAGETYTYDGLDFNRKVLDSSVSGYPHVINITVTPVSGTKPMSIAYRVIPSALKNIYVADTENNRIRMVGEGTSIIETIAGNGGYGHDGDGGLAVNAELGNPYGFCVNPYGGLYIADTRNHRIRVVDESGTITTVAGTGHDGFSGDGGPAVNAQINTPKDIFADAMGVIYIADTENNRIRKIDTEGIITTVAGNGLTGESGDGGPATSARLNEPEGVYVDSSGNIFIADTDNNRIRKVDTSGTITTVAGDGDLGFAGDGGKAVDAELKLPQGVCVDESGNIYIADTNNSRIRKVGTDGKINTVAGDGSAGYSGDGGPALAAKIGNPGAIHIDTDGNIYFTDAANSCVRKINTAGIITTVAGTGLSGYSGDGGDATSAKINKPRDVWMGGVDPQGASVVRLAEMYWRTN